MSKKNVGRASPINAVNSNHSIDSLSDWLRLLRDRRWSGRQKYLLLQYYQQPFLIYQASDAELRYVCQGKPVSRRAGVKEEEIQTDLTWLAQLNHSLVTLYDADYPPLLRAIDDPPIALFAIGRRSLLSEPQIAVVGSRRPTPVGSRVAEMIVADLAQAGVCITSGMALGIDGLAHTTALARSGSTIAVMGCGFNTVYPARHRRLFEQIQQHGLLLSEYPLDMPPTKFTFPQRNRIVSGLSYGVVIVEAAQRSGTLITAKLAAEQNREVMVVPGSALSEQYIGSHQLIQQGAAIVSNAEEILHNVTFQLRQHVQHDSASIEAPLADSKQAVKQHPLLAYIGSEPCSIDEITESSGLTIAEVSAMLIELEVGKMVAATHEGGYINLT